MSDIDVLLIALGVTMLAVSIPAIIRPNMLHKQSVRNRDARLLEIEAGAPETYFEEKRELEAYTPRYNPSNRTLRAFGVVGLIIGSLSIFWGL
ncbi:hypothetical protein [Erythrobacter sp. MTPC3]|uniref:hypothetical protein n=1 Tax=Erythrobacter sp. MTPC3 TaxID=3056564 RepID=UPI0036F1CE1E